MVTQKAIVYLILMQVSSPQVSSQDSSCHQDSTLVNVARQAVSNLTSRQNYPVAITGEASSLTDGVTSGSCASVSSIFPAWEAEFGQNRTVTRLKIFWEGPQDDVYVSVDGIICHTPRNSFYKWEPEYTLDCDVPVKGKHLLIYRQPTVGMLNLSFCEVEIYVLADPIQTSLSASTTTPTKSKAMSTPSVTTSSVAPSTPSTVSGTSMDNTSASILSTQSSMTSTVMSSTVKSTTTTSITTAKPKTSPQTIIYSSTTAPVSKVISTTSPEKPTLQASGAVTGTMIAAIVGVVVLLLIIIVVAVVCRRQKGERAKPKDTEEAAVSSYETCVAEPCDHTRYQNIQSHRTPRGWLDQGSIYVNTIRPTGCENTKENECTRVNNIYVNDQNVSTGTSCYVNVGSNNQHFDGDGESKMYANSNDFSIYENTLRIYENTLNIRT